MLAQAYQKRIPVTVHVSIGADTIHAHPATSGQALGEATHNDFRLFCTMVAGLDGGGVYLNVGSAVMLPEVFLKAVAVVRNFGHSLDGLVAVNVDKESRYRTLMNVLFRPASEGLELIGHHELLLPLLHAAVIAKLPAARAGMLRAA